MLFWSLVGVVGLICYLQIGYRLANLSWRMWHNASAHKGIFHYFMFPMSCVEGELGICVHSSGGGHISPHWEFTKCDGSDGYRKKMTAVISFYWPLKVAWTILFACFIIPVVYLLFKLVWPLVKYGLLGIFWLMPRLFILVTQGPGAFRKTETEAEPVKDASPSKPKPDPMTELQKLQNQAGNLEAGVERLQMELSDVKEKIAALKSDPEAEKFIQLRQSRPVA